VSCQREFSSTAAILAERNMGEHQVTMQPANVWRRTIMGLTVLADCIPRRRRPPPFRLLVSRIIKYPTKMGMLCV